MRSARVVMTIIAFYLCALAWAAAQAPSPAPRPADPPPPTLDAIVVEIQQVTQTANMDLGRLRIERWRADSGDRAQWQQIADSLRKNLSTAVPDLLAEVRSSKGSVSSTFKLYHNLNVVYEYLDSLAAVANGAARSDESDPLNKDASGLDAARKHLSAYIEDAATTLETKLKAPPVQVVVTPTPTPRKIVVDDDLHPAKSPTPKKKKTPPAQPASTPQ